MEDIINKVIIYYNEIGIISYTIVDFISGWNSEESLKLFNKINGITDDSTKIKFIEKDEYTNMLNPGSTNTLKYNPEKDEVYMEYGKMNLRSRSYLWNDMSPRIEYMEEQVVDIYNNYYLENIKRVINHPEGFEAKFLSLDDLTLSYQSVVQSWGTRFEDPYLKDFDKDKLELAESILNNGTFWPILVVEDFDMQHYAVREGTHRIASLKLAKEFGIVPEDYKILCIVLPRNISQGTATFNDDTLSTPITGYSSIECVWGTTYLENEQIKQGIFREIVENGGEIINDYTMAQTLNTKTGMYRMLYVYPLFLRDLMYNYKNIKPSKIINDEASFNEWRVN